MLQPAKAVRTEPGHIHQPRLSPLGLAGLVAQSHPLSWKVPSAELDLPSEGWGHVSHPAWVTKREEIVFSWARPERSEQLTPLCGS